MSQGFLHLGYNKKVREEFGKEKSRYIEIKIIEPKNRLTSNV